MNSTAVEQQKAAALYAEEVMRRYKADGEHELRNELVLHYSYIARTVALEMRSTYHRYATVDEMINQGVIAIIESIERFDLSHGVKFSTFAFTKVRGAVIDYVRKQDWLPRRVRQNSLKINSAYDALIGELGRSPTTEEMAAKMQMTPEEFDKCVYEISGDKMVSYEALLTLAPQSTGVIWSGIDTEYVPEDRVDHTELREVLAREIDNLNEQERTVLSMYYYDELTMKEISKVMGVSEQRIGQINRKLVSKLRTKMVLYMKG